MVERNLQNIQIPSDDRIREVLIRSRRRLREIEKQRDGKLILGGDSEMNKTVISPLRMGYPLKK